MQKLHEAFSQTASSPRQLPETVPAVSFDINLGKRVDFIDFDYHEFVDNLSENGVQPEQIEELAVFFKKGGLTFAGFSAHYDPSKTEIHLGVPRKPTKKKMNENLSHETSHFINHATDKVKPKDILMVRLSNGFFAGGVVFWLLSTGEYMVNPEAPNYPTYGPAAFIALGAALYYLNSEERRARKHAEDPAPVITRLRRR